MAATIPTSAPDLIEISSFTVALSLWNHSRSPFTSLTTNSYVRDCGEWSICRTQAQGLIDQLSVPKSIHDHIDNYVVKIANEVHSWVLYHHRSVFFDNGNDYHLYYHVKHMTWYPDGTINYKQTARNLMKSYRLSDIEKYRFLCLYCLEEEMRQMSPMLLTSGIMDNFSSFSSYPLIYYWNCYFRNELDKIQNVNTNENLSLNRFMLNQHAVDNWPSKEYFFDRLTSEEQVQSAISIISLQKCKYQKLILLKLNESQRLHVYLEIGVDIIFNYAKMKKNEDLLETWFEVHNLITENQFATLFNDLIKFRVAQMTLNEIWIHSSDDFKRFVIELNNHKIIEDVFKMIDFYTHVDSEFVFIFSMLSDVDDAIKEKIVNDSFFTNCCNRLLYNRKYSIFERLLKSSFSDMKKLIEFKRNIVITNPDVTRYCLNFYDTGDVDGLNAFITPLLSNPESNDDFILDYKKDLLMSPNGVTKCVRHMSSVKDRITLNKIIDDGLPTEALAAEFKKQLILSNESMKNLRQLMETKKITALEKFISRFLSSPEDKKALKKRLLDNAVKLVSTIFLKHDDESRWESLLQWCLEDDDALREFKSKLRVDDIFDEILKGCIFRNYDCRDRVSFCTFYKEIVFDPADRFLKWYFVSARNIKEYKVQRVYSWMNIRTINTLLKKKGNSYLTPVMKWFFLKNNKQRVKFKSTFFGQRVALVL